VWNIGDYAVIMWKIKPGGPTAKYLTVDLISVKPSKFVAHICDFLTPESTGCVWNSVPSYLQTLPNGYMIRVNYNNDELNPQYDYSATFQIIGNSVNNGTRIAVQPAPTACIGTRCNNSTAPVVTDNAIRTREIYFSLLLVSSLLVMYFSA
jgi:hypothetical protein